MIFIPVPTYQFGLIQDDHNYKTHFGLLLEFEDCTMYLLNTFSTLLQLQEKENLQSVD
jgi:hypothetical protein